MGSRYRTADTEGKVERMPRGHAGGREKKTPKKKLDKSIGIPSVMYAPTEVEVVKKKRKPRPDREEA